MTVKVDLWLWALDVDDGERERLAAFLSDDETARAARFVFERDRERFVVGRGRLREILARKVSRAPAELRFSYSENGKPALQGFGDAQFNLSHSEGVAVLALSQAFELGVDVEFVRPLKEDVAERFFSRREIDQLASLPADDQLAGFYRCWTRKEAIVKAIGDGLSRPLDSFDVSVGADVPAVVERLEGEADAPRAWRLAHFVPAAGYIGAVACRTGGAPIVLTRHDIGALKS